MKYSDALEAAIRFAAIRHDGHVRVERERLPYISHLISVSILVSNYTHDEETIIAGLLHDILEDTKTTADELSRKFGSKVCEMVLSVTEPKHPIWKERKNGYIAQLETASEGALIVAAADKIHNIRSKRVLIREEGLDSSRKWSNVPDEYVWYHGQVAELLERRLKNPIVKLLLAEYALEKNENAS